MDIQCSCFSCRVYLGWNDNTSIDNDIRFVRTIYYSERAKFNSMTNLTNLKEVAKHTFSTGINWGRMISFLIYSIITHPNERHEVCRILKGFSINMGSYTPTV